MKNYLNNSFDLHDKIYEIRGERVMLDFDLAKIYGYETKQFNRQVRNNIQKFEGEDFMFQLTQEESIILRCKNCTSSWGGKRYSPYAFTESGIYMLMTVLKGDLATKQSRALIRMFRAMKNYIADNKNLQSLAGFTKTIYDVGELKTRIHSIEKEITIINNKLSTVLTKSDISPILLEFDDSAEKELLFFNRELARASEAYINIYEKARKSIYIFDDYIDIKTLNHLCKVQPDVKITIFSDNISKYLRIHDYLDFQKQYGRDISFIQSGGLIHDRFIILDHHEKTEKIYHCGASSKDAGKRVTMIEEINNELIKKSLDKIIAHMNNHEELKLS